MRSLARHRRGELAGVLDAAREELAATDGLVAVLPALLDWPGEDAEADIYRAFDEQAARLVGESHEAMAAARRARRGAQVRAALGTTDADTVTRSAAEALADSALPAASTSTGSAAQPATAEEVAATIDRLLGRLRADVPAARRVGVETALARLTGASDAQEQRRWVIELRHAVDEANRDAARRVRDGDRARLLLADLAQLDDPPEALVAALEEVLLGGVPLHDELAVQVRAVVVAGQAAKEAAVVAATVGHVLRSLGYEVDETFDTVLAHDGLAHVGVDEPGWRDHGVRVRLDRHRRKVGFHLVRAAGRADAAERDVQLEADWCEDVPALLDGVAARGVRLELTARTEPGQLPVIEVPAEHLASLTRGQQRDEQRAEQRAARRRRDRRRARDRGQERGR